MRAIPLYNLRAHYNHLRALDHSAATALQAVSRFTSLEPTTVHRYKTRAHLPTRENWARIFSDRHAAHWLAAHPNSTFHDYLSYTSTLPFFT